MCLFLLCTELGIQLRVHSLHSNTSPSCPSSHTEGQKLLRLSTNANIEAPQQTTDIAAHYVSSVSASSHAGPGPIMLAVSTRHDQHYQLRVYN